MRRILISQIFILALLAAACGGGSSSDAVTDDTPAAGAANDSVDAAASPEQAESASDLADSPADPVPTPGPTPTPTGPRVPASVDPASLPSGASRDFGPAPATPTGDLSPEVLEAVDVLLGDRLLNGIIDEQSFDAIKIIADSGDPRVSWWLADLQRIANNRDLAGSLTEAQEKLLGFQVNATQSSWGFVTDRLIGWDIAEPPDYLSYKRNVYLAIEPRWEPLFVDGSEVDWRLLSWGGVFIDDRPYDQIDLCTSCIPAADNPKTTDVAGGDTWLGDETIIFGVSVNGEHRAYPRSIMEVREMVNDTLGGRDFAMPYCTLCGSAQVFFTDELPAGIERPVLRTSGLLSRSNKVMYDVNTFSIFDTFLGKAVSGPLLEAGIELKQNSVITTTWGQWKADHPDTTVLDITLANGRPDSDLRNTRDADGPIFPIGQVDPRLPVQEDVLGLLSANGDPIAFHVKSAIAAIERGEFIEVDGINVILDAGGVKAVDADGNDLGGHQAFWFAWSQFYPETDLWPAG